MTNAAQRIVELQGLMNSGSGDIRAHQVEQRRLWDEFYPDCSYDVIVWDSWAVRRRDSAEPRVSASARSVLTS